MTHSAAERTSSRAIPPQSRMNLSPNGTLRDQQLTLIDMSGAAGQDGLDLPERIAALERELRYYRRVIPVLARASANLGRPSREHAGELTHLTRWLTDGQRMIGSVSQILAEQPELEIRLAAVERAHRQIRDEVVQLLDDEPPGHDADPGIGPKLVSHRSLGSRGTCGADPGHRRYRVRPLRHRLVACGDPAAARVAGRWLVIGRWSGDRSELRRLVAHLSARPAEVSQGTAADVKEVRRVVCHVGFISC